MRLRTIRALVVLLVALGITGALPAARVTTPCVYWAGSWVIPSGEVRPGVCSPEVWGFSPPKPE